MTRSSGTLESTVVRFTWVWALVFLPIETYLSFWDGPISVSGYVVNVVRMGIALWAVACLRRGRPYAEGLLATGWGWTTAVFWRATNLRYMLASHGEPLDFGSLELWLAPLFTIMAGCAFAGSVVLLLKQGESAS